MSYDPRWHDIAKEWLEDSSLPDRIVDKYTPKLAQQLQDVAEQFVSYDVPEAERDAEEAAYDRHINQKIDEARGK